MTWSRQAKLDFYWARRRAAKKQYVQFAETLGTSKKRAITKARKDVSREYKARQKGYNEINRRDKQIQKLSDKPNLTKTEQKRLAIMLSKQSTQIAKVNERWSAFENQIGFEPIGATDERVQRQS